ncbi:MAG: hypothetical protein AAGG50_13680 [Bacteroidota bacterium]
MTRLVAFSRHVWRTSVLVLVAGLALPGCDSTSDDVDGPLITDLFGPFFFVENFAVSRPAADFTAGDVVTFEAEFSKQINWTVELTGQESGAVARVEGFSRALNSRNARWDGRASSFPFFRNETVDVALLIDDPEAETQRSTLDVTGAFVYNQGIEITSFEEDDATRSILRNFEFELTDNSGFNSVDAPVAEGERFFLLRGTDNATNPATNNFFVGLAEILPSTELDYFEIPTTIPEDLFFNAALYNFGSEFTIVILEVVVDTNGNGEFNPGDAIFSSGDIRFEDFEDFEGPGWYLFSRSLAEFGLSEEQVQQIVAIRPVLISDNTVQPNPRVPVDFGIDYLTFTDGGPFEL